MTFAEVLLRLGSHMVAWLVIYTHCIWLAIIPQVGCGSESDELYRLVLLLAPMALLGSCLLGIAGPLRSVVGYLRWLALPLVVLVPLAARPVAMAFAATSMEGLGLCSGAAAGFWERVWAPCQALALLSVAVMSVRFFARASGGQALVADDAGT